jgi:hypothetical protein
MPLARRDRAAAAETAAPDRTTRERFPARLLYSRKQTSELLGGISLAKLKELEAAGVLIPKRLDPRAANGQVFYTHRNVHAVASDDDGGAP